MPDSNTKLTNATAMDAISRALNANSTAEVYAVGESIPRPTNAQERQLYSATADSVFGIGYAKFGDDWCDEINNRMKEETGSDLDASSDKAIADLIMSALMADADQRHKSRQHAHA